MTYEEVVRRAQFIGPRQIKWFPRGVLSAASLEHNWRVWTHVAFGVWSVDDIEATFDYKVMYYDAEQLNVTQRRLPNFNPPPTDFRHLIVKSN